MKRISIKSTTPYNTEVLIDGEPVSDAVSEAVIRFTPADTLIHLTGIAGEVTVEGGVLASFSLLDPVAGIVKKVKRVEYADGSVWEEIA